MFTINGINWNLIFVNNSSPNLLRSDGTTSLAVTDWNRKSIFVSLAPKGAYLRRIITHEITHAICFSYGITLSLEQEERLCDFVATYGDEIFEIVDIVLGAVRRVG